MATTKQAAARSGIPETLIRAVIRQLGGTESLEDIRTHGVDGGFAGFTYYSDTVEFFKKHRHDIAALVKSMADDLGEQPLEMVCMFGCLGGQSLRHGGRFDEESRRKAVRDAVSEYGESVGRCLYGGRLTDEDDIVANALAWFAAEEVARAFEDE